MAQTLPRRVHTSQGIPRLAVSSSAPHLPTVSTMSAEANWRHRTAPLGAVDWSGVFQLDTPQTNRPVDLRLPSLSCSKSLSCLVVHANLRLRDQQLQLHRISQLAPIAISRPTTSHETSDSAARSTKSMMSTMNDIGELLAQSSAVYATGKKPVPGAAVEAMLQQAREQEAVEREKQERRRQELQRKVAANAASGSVVRQEILGKLEDLRGDREAQDKFETYIGSIRRTPEQRKVKENIRTISKITSAEFAREALERQTARRHDLGQRRKQARQHHEVRSEERHMQLLTLVGQRHEHHELGMLRQKALSAAQQALLPSLMWLALVQLHHSSTVLGGVLQEGRELRKVQQVREVAVSVIQRQFRLMVLRKRFHTIGAIFRLLRRLVTWWQFRRRIAHKTAAYVTLVDFLHANRLSTSAVQLQTKRFIYRVRMVQRCWRAYWVLLTAQVEMAIMHWSAVDLKRPPARVWLDPRVKLLVVRDDFRRRKEQHVDMCIVWQQDTVMWEKQLEQEELLLDAKALFAPTAIPAWDSATPSWQEDAAEESEAEDRAAQTARRLNADAEGRRVRMAKMKPHFPPRESRTKEDDEAMETETRRRSCLLALERRGLVPPGPRPLFKMFVSEEDLTFLGAKVRAKMNSRSAMGSRGTMKMSSRGSSRGSVSAIALE